MRGLRSASNHDVDGRHVDAERFPPRGALTSWQLPHRLHQLLTREALAVARYACGHGVTVSTMRAVADEVYFHLRQQGLRDW